jgi:hypothetical protein
MTDATPEKYAIFRGSLRGFDWVDACILHAVARLNKGRCAVDFGRQVEFGVSTDVDWCPLPRASVGDAQRPACRDPPRDGEPLLAVRG